MGGANPSDRSKVTVRYENWYGDYTESTSSLSDDTATELVATVFSLLLGFGFDKENIDGALLGLCYERKLIRPNNDKEEDDE